MTSVRCPVKMFWFIIKDVLRGHQAVNKHSKHTGAHGFSIKLSNEKILKLYICN